MRRNAIYIVFLLLLVAVLLAGCTPPHANAQGLPSGDMVILENNNGHAANQEQIVVTLKPAPTPQVTPTPLPTATPVPSPTPAPEVTPGTTGSPEAMGPANPAEQIPTVEGKVCYLTFDDGPSKNTEAILKVLEDQGVVATFFVIGENAQRHPARIQAIAAQGSLVANHTQTHMTDSIYKSEEALLKDLEAGRQTIRSILGQDYPDDLMRFPYGSTNRRCRDFRPAVEAAGYRYFDWNALNGDAESNASGRSTQQLYQELVDTVNTQAERGRDLIVLMHDTNSKGKTVEMLSDAIDYIRSLGYTFATLENKPME